MEQNIKLLKECKVCGNSNLTKVLSLQEQYLSPTFVKYLFSRLSINSERHVNLETSFNFFISTKDFSLQKAIFSAIVESNKKIF